MKRVSIKTGLLSVWLTTGSRSIDKFLGSLQYVVNQKKNLRLKLIVPTIGMHYLF